MWNKRLGGIRDIRKIWAVILGYVRFYHIFKKDLLSVQPSCLESVSTATSPPRISMDAKQVVRRWPDNNVSPNRDIAELETRVDEMSLNPTNIFEECQSCRTLKTK
jgi:hypothetical protein